MILVIKSLIVLSAFSLFFSLIARAMGMPSFFAFICSGLCLKLFGLHQTLPISAIGHFGVLLLLFNLGVELSIKDIEIIKKKWFFIFSVVACCIVVCCIPFFFFFNFNQSLILGSLFSISSTAIVLGTLSYNKQLGTNIGKAALGIVIFQDLISVILIACTSGKNQFFEPQTIVLFFIFLALIVLSYNLKSQINSLMDQLLSQGKEAFFFAIVLFLCVCLFTLKDFPFELAALMAGLVLADTDCANDIKSATHDFESLFLNCFFLYIGTEVEFAIVKQPIVWLIFAGVLLFKFVGLFLGSYIMGLKRALFISTIFLSITELSFLVIDGMYISKSITLEQKQVLFTICLLSLFISPIISKFSENFNLEDNTNENKYDIFILGINNYSFSVANFLNSVGISYIMLDTNASKVNNAKSIGFNSKLSQNMSTIFFKRNKLQEAKILVCTLSRDTERVINIQREFSMLKVIAIVDCDKDENLLMEYNIKTIRFPEEIIVKDLLTEVLGSMNIDDDDLINNYTKT